MKKRLEKFNILFFIMLPIIDLLTALSTRFLNIPVSLGIILKGLYTLLIAVYIILYTNKQNKKSFCIYTLSLILYCLFFILTKKHIWHINTLITEITSMYKYLFTGYILYSYIIISKQNKNNNYQKIMLYSLICYTLLLLIPTITNSSFATYMYKSNEGSVGWFYSANEISIIMLMLYPFFYITLNKRIEQKQYWYLLLIIPIIISIYIIGTKTSWYGLILLTIIISIINIIKYLKTKSTNKFQILFYILLPILLIVLNNYSPTATNVTSSINETTTTTTAKNTDKKENKINYKECGKYYKFKNLVNNKKIVKITNVLLSGRESKAYTELVIYKNANLTNKLLGLGFTNNSNINNCYINKYIEIDLLDGLVHYGIIGLLLLIIPFISLLKNINIKNIKNTNKNTFIYLFTIIIILGLSLTSGHIIGYPTPSIYLSILLILLKENINNKKRV